MMLSSHKKRQTIMSKKVLILHGWGGSDFPHWQSWLAGELAKNYGKVSFLKFSDVDFPVFDIWKNELKNELEDFQPDIVICHSLANTLWFHLCLDGDLREVEKLYLVAPPSMNCNIEELKSFFPLEIPKNPYAKNIMMVVSTDDPYIKMDEAQKLQKALNADIKILEDAGHINTDSGFGKWEWILQKLKA